MSFEQAKTVYLPQEIAVTAGSSGNHELTLYYTDAQGVEQTVLYRGGASASHAYNQAGTSRNETQYQQGQRYVFQSSSNGVVADELVQVQSVRVSINNGDSWDPSGQTSVLVKLYEPCAGLTLAEQPIYGSERLGIYRAEKLLSQEPDEVTATGEVAYITGDIAINGYEGINEYVLAEGVEMTVGKEFSFSYAEWQQEFSIRFGDIKTQGQYYARETGKKQYELKDHLGNVQVIVSDRKIFADSDGDGVAESRADVLASYDYYPGGMMMPGRVLDNGYRYGFGSHERDDEIKGTGKHYDFGGYGYDPQLIRRWNIDPMAHKIPAWSPYSYAFGNPINFVDPDGMIPWPVLAKFRGALRVTVSGFYRNSSGSKHGAVDVAHLSNSGQIAGGTIQATHGGVVTVSEENNNTAGNWVVITNGDLRTRYLHMEGTPLVDKGDKVKEGEAIGAIGSTGSSQAPHLHYEIQRKDKEGNWIKINPVVGEPDKVNTSDDIDLKDPQRIIDQRDGVRSKSSWKDMINSFRELSQTIKSIRDANRQRQQEE